MLEENKSIKANPLLLLAEYYPIYLLNNSSISKKKLDLINKKGLSNKLKII